MLKENWSARRSGLLSSSTRYSMQHQDVAILRRDWMNFNRIPASYDNLYL